MNRKTILAATIAASAFSGYCYTEKNYLGHTWAAHADTYEDYGQARAKDKDGCEVIDARCKIACASERDPAPRVSRDEAGRLPVPEAHFWFSQHLQRSQRQLAYTKSAYSIACNSYPMWAQAECWKRAEDDIKTYAGFLRNDQRDFERLDDLLNHR